MRLPSPPPRAPRSAQRTPAGVVREAFHCAPGPAEVFRAGPVTTGNNIRVVIHPGNPGAGAFYTRLAELLAHELNAPVSVLSLVGHHPPLDADHAPHPPLTLAAQVDAAAAFLRAELDANPGGRVAVVGHSIGGTIGARAVAAVEKSAEPSTTARIAAVAALMPYARFNEAAAGQRALRAFTRAPAVRGVAAAAAAALPRGATAALVRATAARNWSCDRALPALLDFIKAGGPAHSFALAADEFRVLATPPSAAWAPYARLGPRLAVFAAPADHWFAEAHWRDVRAAAPDASFAVVDGARHDFVTCADQTARLAAAVAAEVRKRL